MEFNYKFKESFPIRWKEKIIEKAKVNSLQHNIEGIYSHKNFLDYLRMAYSYHYGIVIKPDYFWYTILCEVAQEIKNNAEKYRSLFTKSSKKELIVSVQMDAIKADLNNLIQGVFEKIPSNLKEKDILLNFTTTNEMSNFAFCAAFLDAVSPFYSYAITLCDFPKINVLGTKEDYQLLLNGINNLIELFDNFEKMKLYLQNCTNQIKILIDRFSDKEFWGHMFLIENCGSGHLDKIKGWITELFFDKEIYVNSGPSHISIIEYKNLYTKLEYKMYVGLFSSNIIDNYLIPNFEYFIKYKNEEIITENI